MKQVRLVILAILLPGSIAACGRHPVDKDANAVGAMVIDNNGASAVTGGPPPVSPAAIRSGAIPAALQGRWGLTPGDCTSTRGDAKGLLVISGNGLKFYESRAVPGTGIEASDDGISGSFDFTGEGQSWSKFVSLKLAGDGLLRTERSPMATYTYAKCD